MKFSGDPEVLGETEGRILKRLENMRDAIVRLTSELIRIPTVNPPGEGYSEICSFLSKRMDEMGLEVEVFQAPESKLKELNLSPPRPIVIGTMKGENPVETLHLNGHYDVVPPGKDWTTEPFKPTVKNGKLYGRGSSDMKGGIAAMLAAVEALKRSGIRLKGNLKLSFVPDEEIGGKTGTGCMAELGLMKGNAALIGEASGVDRVCVAHKGALWLEVNVKGEAAHACMAHKAVNAVEKAAKIIVELGRLKEKFKAKVTKAPMLSGHETPVMNLGGVIRGGVKVNVVPEFCTFTIDRRLIPEEDVDEAEAEIVNIVEGLKKADPQLQAEIRRILHVGAAYTPEREKICRVLVETVGKITGRKPQVLGLPVFTDMHYFNQFMPSVIYGPGIVEKAHAADEYIPVEELVASAKVYATTILNMLA
jgi:succinyl-diaminopimelate desuccinylase